MARLSVVTKDYLTRFYEILDEMIRDMTEAELTDSISHNFIVQMIPHHRAAIEMSRNLLRYTTFVPLREIAESIITEQTKSIENMTRALESCGSLCNSGTELRLYGRRFQEIIQVMFAQMEGAPGGNDINCNFLWEMIPHHQGAIRMSENALRFDICPELRPVLQAIIASQKAGTRKMEGLLRCRQSCCP